MGRPANRYRVGAEWITKAEAAQRLGVSVRALEWQMYRRGVGLGTLMRMYAEGRISVGHRGGARHLVHGRWTTIQDEAGRLGVSVASLRWWMGRHRDELGRKASLERAVMWYEALAAGAVHHDLSGRPPRVYRVDGKRMTMAEAAEYCGVSASALRNHVWRAGCSVQTAVRDYERRRKEAAVEEIMGILGI